MTKTCFNCGAKYTSVRCSNCTSAIDSYRQREIDNKARKCRLLAEFCRMSYVIKNEMVLHDLADESHAEAVRRSNVQRYKDRIRRYG